MAVTYVATVSAYHSASASIGGASSPAGTKGLAGKPFSRVIKEMLEMALRMQRFPGIVYVEGPAGRRAHIAGTGLA